MNLNDNAKQRFPLRLSDTLYQQLQARAYDSRMAMHDLVVLAIVNELKRTPRKAKT